MNHTKICTKCQEEKSLDNFRNYKRSKDGKVNWCKPCFKDYEKKHWNSNPERRSKSKQRNIKRFESNRQFVFSYLLEHPCEICEENDPIVLEFDHIDQKAKKFVISESYAGYGLSKIKVDRRASPIRKWGRSPIFISNCSQTYCEAHDKHTASSYHATFSVSHILVGSCPQNTHDKFLVRIDRGVWSECAST